MVVHHQHVLLQDKESFPCASMVSLNCDDHLPLPIRPPCINLSAYSYTYAHSVHSYFLHNDQISLPSPLKSVIVHIWQFGRRNHHITQKRQQQFPLQLMVWIVLYLHWDRLKMHYLILARDLDSHQSFNDYLKSIGSPVVPFVPSFN